MADGSAKASLIVVMTASQTNAAPLYATFIEGRRGTTVLRSLTDTTVQDRSRNMMRHMTSWQLAVRIEINGETHLISDHCVAQSTASCGRSVPPTSLDSERLAAAHCLC